MERHDTNEADLARCLEERVRLEAQLEGRGVDSIEWGGPPFTDKTAEHYHGVAQRLAYLNAVINELREADA